MQIASSSSGILRGFVLGRFWNPINGPHSIRPRPRSDADATMHIFWYQWSDSSIHMNAEFFDYHTSGWDEGAVFTLFHRAMRHEYFHHIVHSWAQNAGLISKIKENPLPSSKARIREALGLSKPMMIEEAMAESIFLEDSKRWKMDQEFPEPKTSYDIWPIFLTQLSESRVHRERWWKASVLLTIQRISGKFAICGLNEKKGITGEFLDDLDITQYLGQLIPNKQFRIDGPIHKKGFAKHGDAGNYTLEEIKFVIHGNEKQIKSYNDWRTQVSRTSIS